MNKKILSILKYLIGWPLSVIALLFIAKIIISNFHQVMSQITRVHIGVLVVGIFFFLVYFFIRSFFWQQLLKQKGHEFHFMETAYLWGMSEIKRYIPGSVWSVVGRTNAFGNKKVGKKTILGLLILEAQFFVIGALVVSLLALPFIVNYLFPTFSHNTILWRVILVITVVGVGTFLNNTYFFNKDDNIAHVVLKKILPSFSFKKNLFLLAIACAYDICFGLGTYFTITSIFTLAFNHIFLFVGFFVFSFFVGYISIITPMGLGVREAVLGFGLSKFISFASASFAAIFARIILTGTELLFLCIVTVWQKIKKS